MKKHFFLLIVILIPLLSQAQDDNKFGIKWAGFVKSDIFFDSRQVVAVRQGHFLLYPRKNLPDQLNRDINAKSDFNILSIQTRLKAVISAPDVLNAKLSGMIEAAFFGNIELNINSFRLRHAIVKLNWPNTELMIGQFWHPMFNTACFPGTVSFNTGTPFQPFSRNPQVRLTQNVGKITFYLTALAQTDFVSAGPLPTFYSTKYIRDAAVPEMNLTLQYASTNESGTAIFFGAGVNHIILKPRLVTDLNYRTDELTMGTSTMAFFKIKTDAITIKLEGVYGQNTTNLTMLGGYAVEKISDEDTGERSYTPINTASFWTDIHTNGKLWQFGVFGGYTQNLGSNSEIGQIQNLQEETGQIYYSRGKDISNVYRVSPRVIYNPGKLRLALELEYTNAAYGTPDNMGVVQNTTSVGNLRFLFATYLFF